MTSIVGLLNSRRWVDLLVFYLASCFPTFIIVSRFLWASWLRSGSTFHYLIWFIGWMRCTTTWRWTCRIAWWTTRTWVSRRWRMAPCAFLCFFTIFLLFYVVLNFFIQLPYFSIVRWFKFFCSLKISKVRQSLSDHFNCPAVITWNRWWWAWSRWATATITFTICISMIDYTLRSPHHEIVSSVHLDCNIMHGWLALSQSF